MATAEGNSVAAANDPLIDGLLQGSQWSFGTGPHVLTYSFNISGVPGSGNWTAAQMAGVRAAFAAWSAVANIQFKQVTSGTYFYQSTADIALSLTGRVQQDEYGAVGEGVFPDANYAADQAQGLLSDFAPGKSGVNYANPAGDIFFDNIKGDGVLVNNFSVLNPGGYTLELMLHEIGHALGLKHPFDDGDSSKPTFTDLGIGNLDTDYNTVMSYNAQGYYINLSNPSTPMPLDILAIQYLYGVNRGTNTGNNTYYFRDNGVVQTIWDAGGYDTLDASTLGNVGGVTLDLRPGAISTFSDPWDSNIVSAIGMSYTPTETQAGPVGPIDNLIERAIGTTGNDTIYGNNADNTLLGGAGDDVIQDAIGNDYLDGGTGADQMAGGTGNDTYIIDNVYDRVTENANEGTDTVIASVQVQSFANVENYTYTGKLSWIIVTDASDNIVIGGSGADSIYTNAGDDTLNGGAGADTLTGGQGDDTYVVDNVGDKVIENANEGNDTIKSSVLLTAPINNVENYIYTGAGNWTFTGTDGDNLIAGGSGKDTLSGALGNDTLDGGTNADTLAGGQGDDTYVIDNAGDKVVEAVGGGTDLIKSSVTINLAAGAFIGQEIENATLIGTGAINVTGNAINNILIGNSGANVIDGGAGADAMAGGLGNDTYVIDDAGDTVTEDTDAGIDTVKSSILLTSTIANVENYTYTGASDWQFTGTDVANMLVGGSGNDKLDGGAGADILTGGVGNDTFIVDNAGDQVIEAANQGTDTIDASISINLSAGSFAKQAIENVTLTGADALNATGNALINELTGNGGDNILDGGTGADILTGGAGDDTYVIDNAGDKVIETAAGGTDTVRSSIVLGSTIANVENYTYTGALAWTFTGDDDDNALTGGSGKDILSGGLGNDMLDGGAGADKLAGGQGNDTYVVDNAGDVVVEAAGEGTDLVKSGVTLNLAAGAFISQEIENVTLTGAAAINVTGNALDNVLTGNDGANVIDGGAGADTMAGGLGNDTYIIDNAGDTVTELFNAGIDTVKTSVAITTAIGNVENYIYTGTGDWTFTGNALNNVITGGLGNDTLDGGAGADTLAGGLGNDIYVVDNAGDKITEALNAGTDTVQLAGSLSSYVLGANLENLDASQMTVAVTATGNAVSNVINGGAGNDTLDGGAGADTLTGGTGDDTYIVDNIGDKVIETAGGGNDTVKSSVLLASLIANVENYTYTGALAWTFAGDDGDNALTGGSGKDALSGGLGNDVLDGGAGADKLIGGQGDDTYVVDNAGDVVVEAAGEGTDLVKSSATLNLAAGAFVGQEIENVTLTGAAAINVTGNALSNILTGNAAANIVDGGAGADTMAGGLGNDTYVIDSAGDQVIENANEGTDTVKTSVAITAAIANVENYIFTGTGDWDFSGNALNNTITGGSGNDTLDGGAGADALAGGLGDDTYILDNAGDVVSELAGQGIDTVILASGYSSKAFSYILGATLENLDARQMTVALAATGNAAANSIIGGGGNDTLDGGAGADILTGGQGNDTYIIDNAGDQVVEAADQGADLIKSSITLDLSSGTFVGQEIENVSLIGIAAINVTGNSLDNSLAGNAASNTISGGDGNDTLDGGAGADKLAGGLGDDIYIIDNAGDIVVEAAGEGTDLIKSSVTVNLATGAFIGQEIENVTLMGTAALNVTGNSLNNVLTGNDGANVIDGGAGADTMAGGLGNDIYIIDNAKDTVTEAANAGIDTVKTSVAVSTAIANVENYTFTGPGNWSFTGNELNNVITGGGGNDTLDGGAGADTLVGGLGDDIYILDNIGDQVIEAANQGKDTIVLSTGYFSNAGAYSGTYSLAANLENLDASKQTISLTLTGNAADNMLIGGSGSDGLNGGTGADTLIGGAGNDIYGVDNVGDKIVEQANGGTDFVFSSISLDLSTGTFAGQEIENVTLTTTALLAGNLWNIPWNVGSGTAALNLTGNTLNNILTGNAGNNVLDGGAGADHLSGGGGNDTYVVDNSGDVVGEDLAGVAGGTDLVESSIDYTLGTNVENLLLLSQGGDINGTGNGLANTITGNDGDNRLDGGAGADTLIGGAGDDTYVVDNVGDKVTELAAEGTDTIALTQGYSTKAFSYTLVANVENLDLSALSVAVTATGNSADNTIIGGAGDDVLDGSTGADRLVGGAGNDTYMIDNADDVVVEAAGQGSDTVKTSFQLATAFDNVENYIYTGSADWTFTGNELDNLIQSGAGSDTLRGGKGDDTYIINSLNDTVIENADEGDDTVRSSVLLTSLIDNVENYIYTGTANWTFTGNELDNAITGSSGKDTLTGGDGNDILDGGAGADTLIGGQGDDTYVIDNPGDKIVELAGGGNDTVRSSLLIAALMANIENYVYTGAINWTFSGDSLDNKITGGSGKDALTGGDGNDVLDGGAGADTMVGGAGNDTYYVDNIGDQIIESAGQGTDTIISSVNVGLTGLNLAGADIENIILTGSADLSATGTGANNVLTGNAGANVLDGGAGADTMIGGAGNDTYYIDNLGDSIVENVGGGIDTVNSSSSIDLTSAQFAGQEIENITLTGSDITVKATGNGLANVITDSSSGTFVTLDGGAGADTLISGRKSAVTTFVVDDPGDKIVISWATASGPLYGGSWYINSSASYTIGDPLSGIISSLTLTGTADINGTGGSRSDWIYGNSGNNILSGGGAIDYLSGGGGDDILIGGAGGDTLYGGAGNDTASYVGSGGGVTINLASGLTIGGDANGDTLSNIENLTGSSYGDTLLGNSGNNVLDGGGGYDNLSGGGGYDTYKFQSPGSVAIDNAVTGGTQASGELDFGAGISAQDLWFTQSGQDLLIYVLGVSNYASADIRNWFGSNVSAQLSEIVLADGSKIDSGVSQLVSAMASYTASNPGFAPSSSTAVMPQDQTVQNAIATAWHH